ncbi:MAG: pectin acetylesterase-family hydrolase [Myxococcota bacterium]
MHASLRFAPLLALLLACDDGAPPPNPEPRGAPITAPAGAWTWVPLAGAVCANGAPTGIGVNLSDASPNVAVFFQGGGACWNEETCYLDPIAASIESGFGAEDFERPDAALFDRDAPGNPVADWSFVFVPYCTGDLHAGNRSARYGGRRTEHRGYRNAALMLERLVATRPGAARILLTGASAGGFGATFNLAATRAAFPGARVDLLNDSGHFLSPPALPAVRLSLWSDAWALAEAFPSDCPGCRADLGAYEDYLVAQDPSARVALLTFAVDPVIAEYFDVEQPAFREGLAARTAAVANAPNAAHFIAPGEGHTFSEDLAGVAAGGTTGMDFVRAMLSDDAAWETVAPE